jgi:hypothetical protein
MDKGTKDKLARSPGENGGNGMPKMIFSQLEGPRRRGRPRKRWKEEVERDLQVLEVRRWRELVTDRKNGRILFDRPKPTAGCNANGIYKGE